MKRVAIGLVAAAAVWYLLTWSLGAVLSVPRLPDCTYEDGSGGPVPCVWDASERGNGEGRSYVVWEAP